MVGGAMRSTIRGWLLDLRYITRVLIFVEVLFLPELVMAQNTDKIASTNPLAIKIEITRPQLTPGSGIGVIAEIRNQSKSTIFLHEDNLILTLPPELEAPSNKGGGWYGNFPAEDHRVKNRKGEFVKDDKGNISNQNVASRLPPGDTVKAFFYQNPLSVRQSVDDTGWYQVVNLVATIRTVIFSELSYIFFSPGAYKFTVSAKYWIDPKKPGDPEYRVAVQSDVFNIAAPQFVILTGAALGGLIAYFILPKARRRILSTARRVEDSSPIVRLSRRIVLEAAGFVGAMLLSSIVTILVARISETQFLIKVSVADFWGAIAIGFIANYAGSAVLNKIIPGGDDDGRKSDGEEK
jgi:hypothetical protein